MTTATTNSPSDKIPTALTPASALSTTTTTTTTTTPRPQEGVTTTPGSTVSTLSGKPAASGPSAEKPKPKAKPQKQPPSKPNLNPPSVIQTSLRLLHFQSSATKQASQESSNGASHDQTPLLEFPIDSLNLLEQVNPRMQKEEVQCCTCSSRDQCLTKSCGCFGAGGYCHADCACAGDSCGNQRRMHKPLSSSNRQEQPTWRTNKRKRNNDKDENDEANADTSMDHPQHVKELREALAFIRAKVTGTATYKNNSSGEPAQGSSIGHTVLLKTLEDMHQIRRTVQEQLADLEIPQQQGGIHNRMSVPLSRLTPYPYLSGATVHDGGDNISRGGHEHAPMLSSNDRVRAIQQETLWIKALTNVMLRRGREAPRGRQDTTRVAGTAPTAGAIRDKKDQSGS